MDDYDSNMTVAVPRLIIGFSERGLLLTHSVGENSIKANKHPRLAPGYCAVPTPKGVMITGGSDEATRCWLWDGEVMTFLAANLTSPHTNHC
jgi:hypothetical protein